MRLSLQALGCCSLTNAQAVHGDDQSSNLYFVFREGTAHFWLWWLLRLGLEWKRHCALSCDRTLIG
jgi:hypothetical protein